MQKHYLQPFQNVFGQFFIHYIEFKSQEMFTNILDNEK
jgi:hypothetical protein